MHKGFTLIELLVVVLIIGILSAVALPQYTKAVRRARVTEIWNYCKASREAQQVYYMTNGEYTEDLANLDIQMPEIKDTRIEIVTHGYFHSVIKPEKYFQGVHFYCEIFPSGQESFSCFDGSSSKKCVPLMPCSNPSILGGSSAFCYF